MKQKTIKMMLPLIAVVFLAGCGGGSNIKDGKYNYPYEPRHSQAWNIMNEAEIDYIPDYTKSDYKDSFGIEGPDTILGTSAKAALWTHMMGFTGLSLALFEKTKDRDQDWVIAHIPKSVAATKKEATALTVKNLIKAKELFKNNHKKLYDKANTSAKKNIDSGYNISTKNENVIDAGDKWIWKGPFGNASHIYISTEANLNRVFYESMVANLPNGYYIFNTMGKKPFATFPYLISKDKMMLFIKPNSK